MNKSIPSFVLGLIFSLIGAICTCLFWLIFVIVGAFAGGAVKTILTVFPIINLGAFILSFIGSFFCFKMSKIGGIIMLISSIISLICFTAICVALKTFSIIIVLFWIPTLFIILAGILAFKTVKKQPNQ